MHIHSLFAIHAQILFDYISFHLAPLHLSHFKKKTHVHVETIGLIDIIACAQIVHHIITPNKHC